MAIQRHVYYSPDRRYRITADTANRAYRIEHDDLVHVAELFSVRDLSTWIREHGFSLADLIED